MLERMKKGKDTLRKAARVISIALMVFGASALAGYWTLGAGGLGKPAGSVGAASPSASASSFPPGAAPAQDSYAIDYDLDYGEVGEALPASCTRADAPIVLPEPVRFAYAFDGWTRKGSEERIAVLNPSMLEADVELVAHWRPVADFQPATLYLGCGLQAVPYVYSIGSETAPMDAAGVWLGEGNVGDGAPTYYIGHNPGVFTVVEETFQMGTRFVVCDDDGNLGVYEVVDREVIPYENTIWTEGLDDLVMPQGEYATLQTCRGDRLLMDIYVGKRIDG